MTRRRKRGALPLGCLLLALACGEQASPRDVADAGPDEQPADGGATVAETGPSADATTPARCEDCPCTGDGDLSELERALVKLPADTWYEAPGSLMRDACVPDSVGVRGVVGCAAIVSAWNGGAYDSVRRRMLIWGGGHEDYWGNELYAFDLRTGKWSRLTEPSRVPEGATSATFFNRDPLSDGQPVSRHTYDGVEFLDDLGVLWAHGGSRARDGGGTKVTWRFEEAKGWTQHAPGVGGYMLATAYHAATRQVLVNATESLHVYHVDTDTWSNAPGFGYAPLWPRYTGGDRTGAIDARRGLFWSVGSKMVLVWDIVANKAVTDDWKSTGGGDYTNAAKVMPNHPEQLFEGGGGEVYNAGAPGFDYDSAADAMVAWPNKGAPYALDLQTKEWKAGSATNAPESKNSGGTYGRWRYLARYNVFLLVNSVDENVHFYKHTAGCGPQEVR